MILRDYDVAVDAVALAGFACSRGAPFEDEVEAWIRTESVRWINDVPRATFQRRRLDIIQDDAAVLAVVAWQDIVRVDLDGIWLEVLAVSRDHQHRGVGAMTYDLVVERLRTVGRDGDRLMGLVHVANARSKRLLTAVGWPSVSVWGDHELWIGHL